MDSSSRPIAIRDKIGFKEFVALIAATMAVNTLAMDTMLPAFANIGESLNVASENQRQWILTAYLLGFGASQIIYGTLSDRFGRKIVLLTGLGIYFIFSIVCALSITFEMLMFARVCQGIGAAGTRVLAISIVRDRYSGRQMSRIMSLAFMMLMIVPALAPSIGQVMMWFASWHWIFVWLAALGAGLFIWISLRLPETIHPEDRRPLSYRSVVEAFRLCLTNRVAIGYMLCTGLGMGGMFGFLNSAQQIFVDVFDVPKWFTLIFACFATGMIIASLINSRIVTKYGTRIVSQSALLGYITASAIHTIVVLSGLETIWTFGLLQGLTVFSFGMMVNNFGAMSMEPLGHVAGTGASVQGCFTTVFAAVLGFAIGQQFNGTVVPLTVAYLLIGLAILGVIYVAESGKLFSPMHPEQKT